MAAGDFSASVLDDVIVKINEVFSGGPHMYEMIDSTETVRALAENQASRPHPVMVNDTCIGVEVKYLKSGRDVANLTYNGTGSSPSNSLACDLQTGFESESATQTYNNNLLIYDVADVDLRDCNNVFQAVDKRAMAVAKTLRNVRKALNEKCVTFLNTNKQTNIDSELASGYISTQSGAVTLNGAATEVQVIGDDALSWESFAVMQDIARLNNLPEDAILVAGRHFFRTEFLNSPYFASNDDARAAAARYTNMMPYFDIRSMDLTIGSGSKAAFVVDPNAYVMWCNVVNMPGMNQIHYDKWETTFEDPIIRIVGPNGQLQPLTYNVVLQQLCDSRDAVYKHVIKERWEIRFQGGLAAAPAGTSSETGILKFTAV